MSDIIERVARAIYCVEEGPCDAKTVARMAVEAMREPTEEMIEAGWNARGEVDQRYRVMIDAALAG